MDQPLTKHTGYLRVKRVLDAGGALVLLVALSWLLVLVALLVLLFEGWPLLFVQRRPGRGGKLFALYKFRTMRLAPAGQNAVEDTASDARRLTRFGRLLRATGIDELPELINILRGDMSFVGPRPLLPEYLPLYTEEQAHRHDVRPGLTGLAQARGRNLLSWEERFAADLEYVREVSLGLDLKILCMTVAVVLKGRGAEASDAPTSAPFTGNKTR